MLLFMLMDVCASHAVNCTNTTQSVPFSYSVATTNVTVTRLFNSTTNKTTIVNTTVITTTVVTGNNVTSFMNCTVPPHDEQTLLADFDPNNWHLLVIILVIMFLFLSILVAIVYTSRYYKTRSKIRGKTDSTHVPVSGTDSDDINLTDTRGIRFNSSSDTYTESQLRADGDRHSHSHSYAHDDHNHDHDHNHTLNHDRNHTDNVDHSHDHASHSHYSTNPRQSYERGLVTQPSAGLELLKHENGDTTGGIILHEDS